MSEHDTLSLIDSASPVARRSLFDVFMFHLLLNPYSIYVWDGPDPYQSVPAVRSNDSSLLGSGVDGCLCASVAANRMTSFHVHLLSPVLSPVVSVW